MTELVNGLIPAGTACPFLGNCKFQIHHCPTDKKPKRSNFSCAAARLHDIIVKPKDHAPNLVLRAKSLVQKVMTPQSFAGRDVIILDDDGYAD